MKNGIIFARKSTWRSRLDLEYLDETSRRKISGRAAHSANSETVRKLRQFGDYASKETLGQVHAGGFLHDLIRVNADGASIAPSKLTNDERKKRISESWCRHLRKLPTSSENPVIQDQDLRGHQPQRCAHSDLDSPYGHPAAEVFANAEPARLESF